MLRFKKNFKTILKYIVILIALVIALFPVYWMVVSSVAQNHQLLSLPPHFIPETPSLDSYKKILQNVKYLTYFKNSFIAATGAVLVTLTVSILAGYTFSRYRFRGKTFASSALLSVQMFPVVAILISLYTFYYQWGLLNTYQGVILADVTFCLPLAITLMKAFFDTLPKSIDESAKIDGAGRLKTLSAILMPLTKPGLVAVGVYTFLHAWDDFLLSLIIMQKESLKTLPVGIAQSFMGEYAHDYASMMAFAVAGSLPIVIAFVFSQKHMIAGLTSGAVKG